MITLFHTTRSTPEIQRVQVERQTTKTVVIDGRRRDKRGSWGNYYDTWEEAKDSMSNSARGRVALCRAQLVEAEIFLSKVQLLQPITKAKHDKVVPLSHRT